MVGCGTIDLGDDPVAPEVRLDEGVFHCRVQPEVIGPSRCASGGDGESGACHSARSSLRLASSAENDAPPSCEGGAPVGTVPLSYQANLEAVRFTVTSDPLASPLYRRPTGLDAHPRVIFDEGSAEAELLFDWIARGAQ